MYSQSVVVESVSEEDRKLFFKSIPFAQVIDLPVSDEMIARFKAVRMINDTLPIHESVTKILSSVPDGNGGYVIRANVLD